MLTYYILSSCSCGVCADWCQCDDLATTTTVFWVVTVDCYAVVTVLILCGAAPSVPSAYQDGSTESMNPLHSP